METANLEGPCPASAGEAASPSAHQLSPSAHPQAVPLSASPTHAVFNVAVKGNDRGILLFHSSVADPPTVAVPACCACSLRQAVPGFIEPFWGSSQVMCCVPKASDVLMCAGITILSFYRL